MFILSRLTDYAKLMRLDKPIGILLLLWPTLWALWIAGEGHPSKKIIFIFLSGVVIMRSAGCVINDLADRKIDKKVRRTQQRPLAVGAVTVKEAVCLFIILCLAAFFIALQLNLLSLLLAFIALIISSFYPLTKRITYFPQIFLGIGWYMGILMAFAAQLDSLPAISWLIYITAVIWTVVYDTMYAMADREDDIKIGIKSTAILFAQYDRIIIALLQLVVLGCLTFMGWWLKFSYFYFISLVIALILAGYQQYLIYNREADRCIKAFLNNHWFGLIIFIGIVLEVK